MNKKFEQRVNRLADKISMSITPVPGFIMGLSGTDSIVAFLVCYEALKKHGKQRDLLGIHYVWAERKKPTWFELHIIPWLQQRCPEAWITVTSPYGGQNIEEARFADLKIRCSQGIPERTGHNGEWRITPYCNGERSFWLAACINNTEKKLGKYTILAKAATIWPVATLWKTDVLQICRDLGVPEIAMEMARLPDCICGRDELAAQNLELIDKILKYEVDPYRVEPDLLMDVTEWVRNIKKEYEFKERTPYMI